MGSVGNPNSWAPYDSYKDCSQGICSIYCPQWCYFIFPPPPPLGPPDGGSTSAFSPVIIAVIGILASALLLVIYYTIMSRYCGRRTQNSSELEANRDQMTHDQWQVTSTGLDESSIKAITVFKYKKSDGLVESSDCAVCLSEFMDDERLRLLPKCSHAFHLPCIDTWLKSHSNCPLCRANVASIDPNSQNSSTLNISSLEIERQSDLILVVDDQQRSHQEEVVVVPVSDFVPKNPENSDMRNNRNEIGEEGENQFRRSISLDSFSCRPHILIADILHIEEDQEELQVENYRFPMNRSISMGRFMLGKHTSCV